MKKIICILICGIITLSLVGCSFTEGFKDGYNTSKEVNTKE